MDSSVRYFVYGLVTFLGVIAAGFVASQSATNPPTLVSVQGRGPVSGGLQVLATYRTLPGGGAANSSYFSVPATLPSSTVGSLARAVAMRTAPAAAVLGVIAAAGWFIDQSTQQIMMGNPAFPAPIPTGDFFYRSLNGLNYATPEAAARAMIPLYPQFAPMVFNRTVCTPLGSQLSCEAHFFIGTNRSPWFQGFMGLPNNGPPLQPQRDASPVPIADVGRLIINSPQTWPTILRNFDGSPVRTPELVSAGQALGAQLAAGTGPAQSAGWDTGLQGGSPQPQPQPQPDPNAPPMAVEFPQFCQWATKVCDFIDWFREDDVGDDSPQVPEEQLEALRVPWSSGFGGGSCPADKVVQLDYGWEVMFPVQPLCDLASLLRPLVILLAAIMSLYLIIGGSRAT